MKSQNSEKIQQKDRRSVWHPWSPLSAACSRLTLSHGEGYRVWDINGKGYIDAASMNLTCGYGHPEVSAAIYRQLLKLQGIDLSLANHEPAEWLAERLAQCLPDGLSKTLFVNSGSEGIEAALFIAASYWAQLGTPRLRVVSFAKGYHGSTLLDRHLSRLPNLAHPFNPPFPVTHVELPMAPRALRRPESLKRLLQSFENALSSAVDDLPMAVVVEPFLNVGGGILLPAGFLHGLRELCHKTGALLILDEVSTGYGRSGKMFAFQHEAIVPDILVSSKGLASGYMPIAAVTVQQNIYHTFDKDPILGGLRYGHTTSGHAVACAAALATLDILERENLCARAQAYGTLLLERFATYAGSGSVADVRGFGLILILEMSSLEAASRLRAHAELMGLLLRQTKEAIMVVPPMTIDAEGIDQISEILNDSFSAAGCL